MDVIQPRVLIFPRPLQRLCRLIAQPPRMLADNALQSSLYCDGWWAWYGTALLTDVGAGEAPLLPYGRVEGTSARDYLDLLTAAHARLDELLASPRDTWPARQDGKLKWLQAKLDQAKLQAAQTDSDETAQALTAAGAAWKDYLELVRMGGY